MFTKSILKYHQAFLIVLILCLPFMRHPSALSPCISSAAPVKNMSLLDEALQVIAMNRGDLSVRPDLYEAPLAFDRFSRWMEKPLEAPKEAQQTAKHLLQVADDPVLWLKALSRLSDITLSEPLPLQRPQSHLVPSHLPEPLREAVIQILDAVYTAEMILDGINDDITPKQMNDFEKYLYPEHVSGKDFEKTVVERTKFKELRRTINIAGNVNTREILKAGIILLTSLGRARELLTSTDDWKKGVESLSFTTTLGRVIIGGVGSDIHHHEASLVIDLGGNDLYRGKIASGRHGKCSVVLDLDGDDHYIGEDLTQGAGFWGIGILFDLQGNDFYKAHNFSQGASLFGIGLLMDAGGIDSYLGNEFVQAASWFGWAGIVDLAGEDTYQCQHSGQAHSGVQGISCLSDIEGNDKYLSGTRAPDPREPGMNQSFSQGFAWGIRNLSGGGLALLADRAGNDFYQCQYFGQGSSYWMGMGILYDQEGKDTYIARRYSQGAGIHFSFGLLMDVRGNDHTFSWGVSQGCGHDYGVGILVNEAGNDTYVSNWLSMGASEANGVGIFVDNSGYDGYDTNTGMAVGGLTQGRRAGGIGLFIDAAGKDRYSKNGTDNSVWSASRWAVGIDENNGRISGLNILLPAAPPPGNTVAEEIRVKEERRLAGLMAKAETVPYPEDMEMTLAVASHWGLERKIPVEAQDRLLGLEGSKSVPFMVERLNTPDVLSLRLMNELFAVHAYHAVPALIQVKNALDPLVKSRALYFLGQLKDSKALKSCIEALEDPSWRVKSAAIRAIGEILDERRLQVLQPMKQAVVKTLEKNDPSLIRGYLLDGENALRVLSVLSSAVPIDYQTHKQYEHMSLQKEKGDTLEEYVHFVFDHLQELRLTLEKWTGEFRQSPSAAKRLMPYLSDPQPALRKTAAFSLGQMNEKSALPELIALLNDPYLEVRDATVLSIAFFQDEAIDSVHLAMKQESPSFKILALDVLSKIKSDRASALLEEYRNDPNPNVRRMAKQALGM
ncbi:MAG: HEAT repeat domain-containing protein [Desulfobacteraceae bacterium]